MAIKPEVISLAAAPTYELIMSTNVHACPNNKDYNYKPRRYITLRKKDSVIEAIFVIDNIIILDPDDKAALDRIDPKYKKQLSLYIERRPRFMPFTKGENKFYILSDREDLPHEPFIEGYQKNCYFTLDELRAGHREVIPIGSEELS